MVGGIQCYLLQPLNRRELETFAEAVPIKAGDAAVEIDVRGDNVPVLLEADDAAEVIYRRDNVLTLKAGSERDVYRAQRASLLRQLMLGVLIDDVAEIAANQLEPLGIPSGKLQEDLDEHFVRNEDRLLNRPYRPVQNTKGRVEGWKSDAKTSTGMSTTFRNSFSVSSLERQLVTWYEQEPSHRRVRSLVCLNLYKDSSHGLRAKISSMSSALRSPDC